MHKGSPIAYLSKALDEKHKMLSVYEEEMLAISLALQIGDPTSLEGILRLRLITIVLNSLSNKESLLLHNKNG